MGAHRLWRAKSAKLLWEKWPEESVVYHSLSGETHYLNQVATLALERLALSPQNAEQLTQELSIFFEYESVSVLHQQMQRLLEEFDQLGLIEPVE